MLQKGDQGADRQDPQSGKVTELNTEKTKTPPAADDQSLLLQDEKAQRFYNEIQKLKQDLHFLKKKEVLPLDVENLKTYKAAADAKAGGAEKIVPGTKPAATAEPKPAAKAKETPKVEPKVAVKAVEVPKAEPKAEPKAAVKAVEVPKAEPKVEPKVAAKTEETPKAEPKLVSKEEIAKAFESQYREQMEAAVPQSSKKESDRAQRRATKAAAKEAYRKEKAARNEERREERRARAKQKQMERELRAEVKRKKRLADKSAEMGGGIVNKHDTTVTTELQPVTQVTWRDLLGIVPPAEKRAAASEGELQTLLEEQEKKTAEARAAASQIRKVRASRYRNSSFGQKMHEFKSACERHKVILLNVLSMILLVSVGLAGVFNYYTAYEYSYNGHMLGYVKSKDQVLQITDMVQEALAEDKEMPIIIDAKDDIAFKRVSMLDKDVAPDTSDEVLRRLTYVGDLNVKAYGIYVNGDKIGSVDSKKSAAEVLKMIEDRYASDKKGTKLLKAEILENVEIKKSNSSLRKVYSPEYMAELLCTSGHRETVHTVIAGETLNDIATMYGTTEEKLIEDNEGVDPKKLEVGSTLLIRQNAPVLTVRMTERRDYTHKIKYPTIEKKTDKMYEGDEEVQQEGKNGSEELTEQTVSINGEVEDMEILTRNVTKEPVEKIVLVGTAERPPTVGDGVYIWPLESGYTLTSRYGHRWGRLHAGIDLGTPVGNDVLAADGGTVTRAGYFGGYGYCVDIDHQNGQMTRYGHLSSILVDVGDEVYEGQHIAESGNSGASTGPHLHFEIHSNGQSHDPLQDLP